MLRPKLVDTVLIYQQEPDTAHFAATNTGLITTFKVDPIVVNLLETLDGSRTVPEIHALFGSQMGYQPELINSALDVLTEHGFLDEEADLTPPADFTGEEVARFDRQIRLFHELGAAEPYDCQRRLRESSVIVVGTGGTGSWIAFGLAAAGVGRLLLCDFDTVESSNLNRQVFFGPADVGRLKVDRLAERIREFSPQTEVEAHPLQLSESGEVFQLAQEGISMVMNCADQPAPELTAKWVSDVCLPLGIPHTLGGAYAARNGLIGPTVLPGKTACWYCFGRELTTDLLPAGARLVRKRTCPGGSVAPLSAVVANIEAWDAVCILSQCAPPPLAGRIGQLDFLTHEIQWRDLGRVSDCSGCGGL